MVYYGQHGRLRLQHARWHNSEAPQRDDLLMGLAGRCASGKLNIVLFR